MPDPVTQKVKSEWFSELLKTQEEIAAIRSAEMCGKTYEVLVEDETKEKNGMLTGRTDGNVNIDFPGDPALIGSRVPVTVTNARHWILTGELAQKK